MEILEYDHQRDLESVKRIWKEVGWVQTDEQAGQLNHFFSVGDAVVLHIDGEAECAVHSTPGAMRHGDTDLKLGAVTAVTTSRIARKLGAARKLTARILARQAQSGCEVSALGMFDQGFYDQVGFGTGSYSHYFKFDPTTLRVDGGIRPPKRLTKEDWPAISDAMRSRLRGHGGCVLDPPEIVRSQIGWTENPFGLGYFDVKALTHFIWGEAKTEHGPYIVSLMGYRNTDQLFEL
ncbi:MAG: GNAT family N-acetyltransferase, partial [Gammaproteobacteria bacterium]|nr:GNAT family N-acetyltransferase [Gammaproteobacteria bacterium]